MEVALVVADEPVAVPVTVVVTVAWAEAAPRLTLDSFDLIVHVSSAAMGSSSISFRNGESA